MSSHNNKGTNANQATGSFEVRCTVRLDYEVNEGEGRRKRIAESAAEIRENLRLYFGTKLREACNARHSKAANYVTAEPPQTQFCLPLCTLVLSTLLRYRRFANSISFTLLSLPLLSLLSTYMYIHLPLSDRHLHSAVK